MPHAQQSHPHGNARTPHTQTFRERSIRHHAFVQQVRAKIAQIRYERRKAVA